MKLSELRGEAAIIAVADCIDPLTNITTDKDLMSLKGKVSRAEFIKELLRKHPKDVICILAAMDQTPVEEYSKKVGIATLPVKLGELMSDPELAELFPSQSQNKEETSFGSATENTEVKEN